MRLPRRALALSRSRKGRPHQEAELVGDAGDVGRVREGAGRESHPDQHAESALPEGDSHAQEVRPEHAPRAENEKDKL